MVVNEGTAFKLLLTQYVSEKYNYKTSEKYNYKTQQKQRMSPFYTTIWPLGTLEKAVSTWHIIKSFYID